MKWALVIAALSLLPNPSRAGTDVFIGEVNFFPYVFCPIGYMPTDGRLLAIGSYSSLYSLIGNTFGGSLADATFALPTLKPLQSEAGGTVTPCIAVQGVYPQHSVD